MSVVTRFAPSPTGYLHVGGVRTALYSWLHARRHGGRFILRIEDTDQERSTEASVQAILQGMEWLGLDYDEGPHYQTARLERYREAIDQLLDSGRAYRCTCSRERLDELREAQKQAGQKPRYDGHCRERGIAADCAEPFVVRFRNPDQGEVSFDDRIRGTITVANAELDDLIIARSDGMPTYNLTVVVDDADMGVTQVVRGDDHINNTPRQINLFLALGMLVPEFAHVPMILGDDGQRLSKRHGAVSVLAYRELGYLPDALLNYLVRLGWSAGDQELFSREQMIELFDLRDVNRAPSAFNTEKLDWLNQQYLLELPAPDLEQRLRPFMDGEGMDLDAGPDLGELAVLLRERARTLVQLAALCRPFYADFERYDEKAAKKQLKAAALAPLELLEQRLTELGDWQDEQALHAVVAGVAESLELGMGKVGPPLRVAVLGAAMGPNLEVVLRLLGPDRTLARIRRARNWIAAKSD